MRGTLSIMFGDTVAVWFTSIDRPRDHLEQPRSRVLVGAIARLGDGWPAVQQDVREALGLGQPVIAWHALRNADARSAIMAAQGAAA